MSASQPGAHGPRLWPGRPDFSARLRRSRGHGVVGNLQDDAAPFDVHEKDVSLGEAQLLNCFPWDVNSKTVATSQGRLADKRARCDGLLQNPGFPGIPGYTRA